jgi:hypothetical protein
MCKGLGGEVEGFRTVFWFISIEDIRADVLEKYLLAHIVLCYCVSMFIIVVAVVVVRERINLKPKSSVMTAAGDTPSLLS